jgi:predicted nucleic acid-binding protein
VRAVVDTSVIAYLLLGTKPFLEEVRKFWDRVHEPAAPAIWEAELANIVWMAIRSGIVPPEEGPSRLSLAARLGVRSIPTRRLWRGALVRAVQSDTAVYDALFVELAVRERLPLVTFDAKVLSRFPEVAARPRDLPA